jgi:hypothetical protein
MSNIRTANKRHKRAIVTLHARRNAAKKASIDSTQPVVAAKKS